MRPTTSPTRQLMTAAALTAALAAAPSLVTDAVAAPSGSVAATPRIASGTVAEGRSVAVTVAVRNPRGRTSARSHVRLALSRNGRLDAADTVLAGARPVRALRAGGRATVRTRLAVPPGTPPGAYRVLACAAPVTGTAVPASSCSPAGARVTVTPDPERYVAQAWSDAEVLRTRDAGSSLLLLQARACTPLPGPSGAVPFRAAQATVWAYLQRVAGRQNVAALRSGPLSRNATRAEQVAGAAAVGGERVAALAALMAAHRADPLDPSHLVNAAPFLVDLDMPRQALAFLDQAERLGAAARAPMGISPRAVILTNRGYAQIRLGRYADARRSLESAARIEPLLSEARKNLVVAELCVTRNATPLIPRWNQAERRRFDLVLPPGENPVQTPEPGVERLVTGVVFDVSGGKPGRLPNLTFPVSAVESLSALPRYELLRDRGFERLAARSARDNELRTRLNATTRSRVTQRRNDAIMDHILAADDQPFIAPARRILDERTAATVAAQDAFWSQQVLPNQETMDVDEFRAWCTAALPGAHSRWRAAVVAQDAAMREYFAVWHPHVNALAGHLSNRDARELARLQIEAETDGIFYSGPVDATLAWAQQVWKFRGICTPEAGSGFEQADEAPDVPDAPECPAWQKLNPSISFARIYEIGLDCENLEAETSAGWGPVAAFVGVESDLKDSYTIIVGSKGEIAVGETIGAKSGFYVKIGFDDTIRDFGWRVKVEEGVKVGPAAIKTWSDTVKFSFVGLYDD